MEPGPNQSSPTQCWSNVVKKEPPQKDPNPDPNLTNRVIVQSCKSAEGISIAVVDANAVIQGGEKLHHLADKFVTVPEVLAEIRDPVSRHRLAIFPFTVDSMEPTPEALNMVIKFARATGDLQTLSDIDLKLIALTYTLEAQIHGTKHLRDAPPPIHTVNVKRLPENEMPGWGSNVPNLEEWEALEQGVDDGSNTNSRILPLKDLSLNLIPEGEQSVDGSVGTRGDVHSENHEDVGHGYRRHQRYPPKIKETNIEGKKMIADGVDASQGQFGDDAGDWRPAVSRSTHRRYLRRKARSEYYEALSEKDSQQEMDKNNVNEISDLDALLYQNSEAADSGIKIPKESEMAETRDNSEDLSAILKQMRVDEDPLDALQEGTGKNCVPAELEFNNLTDFVPSSGDNANIVGEAGEADIANSEFVFSHPPGSVDTSFADDDDSEQSWMLRSLSESSVACVTGDYAMQNVLLQIGLRLLAPGGMQIRQLHRWILKCHACYTVTAEIGRIFCPKCGNGGTLRKVAVTVSENGIILAARRPRIMLRGTKFSLPLPQGGRDAVAKNPILREDQLPQKFLNPKTKKKVNKQGDDFFTSDDIFSHHTDKRAPFQPPVRKALAVFSQKRNPNDNHYSRPKH